MNDNTRFYWFDSVKAMGSGKVGGYVIRFGTPETADVQGDYFAADGDYGLDVSTKARIVYHHGLTKTHGAKRLGVADLSVKADGIWGEGTIDDGAIYARAEAGELGWSSGSVDRLTSRRSVKGKSEINAWPLIEVSLTPTPVDPRNRAITIKSLIEDIEGGAVAVPSLVDRSDRLVADCQELACLYERAVKSRASEGRTLSPVKRAAIKALADALAELANVPSGKPDPDLLRKLRLRMLADRI